MGNIAGPGFVRGLINAGACYAAQSGFCDDSKSVPIDFTYGSYY